MWEKDSHFPSKPLLMKGLLQFHLLLILTKIPLQTFKASYFLFQTMLLFFFFLDFIIFHFREREREGEREEEKHQCVVASHVAPHWGPGLQPRHMSRLRVEPATLWFAAHAQSTKPHQPGPNYASNVLSSHMYHTCHTSVAWTCTSVPLHLLFLPPGMPFAPFLSNRINSFFKV